MIYESEGWPGHITYALDSQNGALKWQFKIAGMPLALGNNRLLYLGAFDGNVYALDAASGALRWIFSTKGKVGAQMKFKHSPYQATE